MQNEAEEQNSKLAECFKMSTSNMLVSLNEAAVDEVQSKHLQLAGDAKTSVKNCGISDDGRTFVQSKDQTYEVGVIVKAEFDNIKVTSSEGGADVDVEKIKQKNQESYDAAMQNAFTALDAYFRKFLGSASVDSNTAFTKENMIQFIPDQANISFQTQDSKIQSIEFSAFQRQMTDKLKGLAATKDKLSVYLGFKFPYKVAMQIG